jgi:ABC-type microcin C transport system duplicated ATPase subunit YejF
MAQLESTSSELVLDVRSLCVDFDTKSGPVRVLDDISFTLKAGSTLGIVGESGCGKSTTGLAILRLLDNVEGTVRFDGIDVLGLEAEELRRLRRRMQIVFQDPYSSLNPRQTAENTIRGPLNIQNVGCTVERNE